MKLPPTSARAGQHRPLRWVLTLVVASAFAGVAPHGSAAEAAGPGKDKDTATYIVQMALDPVVTYDGGVANLAPTAPTTGQKVDPGAAKVTSYVEHLKARHDAALGRVGRAAKLYDFAYSFDGFAAKLTGDQAGELAAMPDVIAVTKDEMRTVDTSSTPSFLGLDARGGLWDQLGGPTGTAHRESAGDGIVIGTIDSGIWPEMASFSDRDARGKVAYGQVPDFRGECESGDDSWGSGSCNNKLIGARHFDAAWGGDEGLEAQRPWEYLSPRDYNGHGTHTASTAGGNNGVTPVGAEVFGTISGIAPRARIAAYKALWSTQDGSQAHGYTSDLVAAIDQAVADGVDVINFSVSGTSTDLLDPVEVAFLFAADAGVFVSASAGNSGPAGATVAHPGPWLTTVAAGTHDRTAQGSVTLGSGARYTGASAASTAVGPAPLIDSTAAALPGVESWQAAPCYPASRNGGSPVLDPAKVKGKIVLCDQGDIPPADKSQAVKDAGGVGMILANTSAGSLTTGVYLVPTVNIADTDRAAVKAYAATPKATAKIARATIRRDVPAPYTAAFSSRGPLIAAGGDLLKPDVIAPGQDILAAVGRSPVHGLGYAIESGTSMSAPHVAGIAALLRDLHPDWSPMMIKSALMTSGSDVLDGPGTDPAVIFEQGAGHVRPNAAADPGLVYDSRLDDWLAFLCGTTDGVEQAACDGLVKAGHSLDPSDLNVASIAIGRMPGTQTVTRKVTNVSRQRATYTASITGLDGMSAKVSPRTLTLNPGQTKSFTVTFTRTTAAPNAYLGGQLTWTDRKGHTVRTPIVVHPTRPREQGWTAGTLAGGPTWDQASQTGYIRPQLPIRPGRTAGDGLGVGSVSFLDASGGGGTRAVRWNADGWKELGGLGVDANGSFQSYVYGTDAIGRAVGNAEKYAADGSDLGNRPVRWDAGSSTAVELDSLGTGPDGMAFGTASAVNAAGTTAGDVNKYLPDGTEVGRRAVRWDAGGTAVTELGHIGAGTDGQTNTSVNAINENGDIAGWGMKRDGDTFLGSRAVRWAAGSTDATELGVLGKDPDGSSFAQAYDINDTGTAVGSGTRYHGTVSTGQGAIRWAAGATAATELEPLGTDKDGNASANAYAVNNAGAAVGSSSRYDGSGTYLGDRAARWGAGGTACTELEQLEISPTGQAQSFAFDVNNAGLSVGTAFSYSDDRPEAPGDRAVLWTKDGTLVDLTSLLPADSGWTLSRAMSISDTNWVTGIGLYDPDGDGEAFAYLRLFLMRVEQTQA